MNWSKYQLALFEAARNTNDNLVIAATAGSGKSTSLIEVANIINQSNKSAQSIFLAFNKSIQRELEERLPAGFESRTINSFGFGFLRNISKFWKIDAQKYNKLSQYAIEYMYPRLERNEQYLLSRDLADIVNMTRNNNVDLFDEESFWQMVFNYGLNVQDGYIEAANSILIAGEYLASDRKEYPQDGFAIKILNKTRDFPKRFIDYTDQVWLPVIWNLVKPVYDIILVDEAQDLNAVQLEMILQAINHTGRLVAVGDRKQCQPPGTKVYLTGGETKNIEDIEIGDEVVSYCRRSAAFTGRYTQGQRILNTQKELYSGKMYSVSCAGKVAKATENHKWLVRFSDRGDFDKNVVYLMRQGSKYRVGWCQLFTSSGMNHLGMRTRLERADESWILSVHDNKTSATIEESYVSARFGIPTVMFTSNAQSTLYTQDALDTVFAKLNKEINLEHRAKECLEYFGRNINYPFFSKLNQKRQGRTTLFVTESCNLLNDIMSVSIYDGQRDANWFPVSVEIEQYNGYVYSLEVDRHELYVADGILTHNSIYSFAGADHNSIDNIIARTNAVELPLSITYRCPLKHVELAKQLDPSIEAAPNAKDGFIGSVDESVMHKAIEELYNQGESMMVLCRTNAPLVKAALSLLANRLPAQVRGRDIGGNIINIIEKLAKAKSFDFDRFHEIVYEWYLNERDKMLKKRAKEAQIQTLNDKYETILALYDGINPDNLNNFVYEIKQLFTDDTNCRLQCSTVHKSKGLESDNIFILKPDKLPLIWKNQSENDFIQEMNIKFVALTRSKNRLIFVNDDTQD